MSNYGPSLPAERRLYDHAGHQLDPRKLEDIRLSLPHESEGRCRKCQTLAVLGDGLCCACWDEEPAK